MKGYGVVMVRMHLGWNVNIQVRQKLREIYTATALLMICSEVFTTATPSR